MRILHTADLHLGRQFMGLSLDADFDAILDQIVAAILSEQIDVLLISGDVFDRASPPNSAIRQVNRFLRRVIDDTQAAVVMISGNHDSGDRIEAMSIFSTPSRVLVRGIADAHEPPLILHDAHGAVAFSALPFSYEYAAREAFGTEAISTPADVITAQIAAARPHVPAGARWVVLAHAFVAGGAVGDTERALTRVGGIETVPAQVFDGADYVALGHLHKPQQVGAPHIRYSGAPLAFGFDEVGSEKSMTIIDLAENAPVIRTLPFRPLRQVRRLTGALTDLLAGPPSDDFIQIVLTDDTPQIDPMQRLRTPYPNVCHLSYARQTRAPETKSLGVAAAALTPLDMVSQFIALVDARDPNADELALLADQLHTLATQDRT